MLMRGDQRRLRIGAACLARRSRCGVFGAMAVPVVIVAAGVTAAPSHDTTQAKIAVARPATAGAPAFPAGTPANCLPFPRNLQLNPRFPLPKPPAGSRVFHQPQRACAYLAGFMNVRKLDAEVPVGPGLTDLRLGLTTYANFTHSYSYLQQDVAGQFEYHGLPELPPARATLLAFGRIPVSATIHISEIGSLSIALIACTPAPKCPNQPANVALYFGRVSLRISDVKIDGVPLNVGSHCQTATPFNFHLTGLPPAYNVNLIHGMLTGTVTIPPFKGCVNGDRNLDPVFTASVSGPGNFVKVAQAPICIPKTGGGCPPVKPVPEH